MNSGGLKPREPRHQVQVPARMRTDAGWVDVAIADVSEHGLMFRSAAPPRPGAVIEIRRAHLVIIGRSIWSTGARCGVRTQDVVDMEALVQAPRARPPGKTFVDQGVTRPDRRQSDRPRHDERAERSRNLGRLMQYGAGLAWAAAGAGLLLLLVVELLSRITAPIVAALA